MSDAMDRREFLKIGAISAVGVNALGGRMGFGATPTEKSLRLGIVGVGDRGTSHLETLLAMPGVEIPLSATSTRSTWPAGSRWWRKPARSGRRDMAAMWRTTSA